MELDGEKAVKLLIKLAACFEGHTTVEILAAIAAAREYRRYGSTEQTPSGTPSTKTGTLPDGGDFRT